MSPKEPVLDNSNRNAVGSKQEKPRMMLGSRPKRIAFHLLLGLVLAVGLIMACLFSYPYPTFRNVVSFVWAPASWLVRVSNAICPPSGVKCVFGSESQGSHHLWFGACLLMFWWASLSIVSWVVLALTQR